MKRQRINKVPAHVGGNSFPGKSEQGHDSYYCSPAEGLRQLVVICNGSTINRPQAIEASHTVISIFQSSFQERKDTIEDPSLFLKEISLRAAAELMWMDHQLRKQEGHQAALTAFFRDGSQLFTVNVGSGRIILYRNRKLTQLTRDHVRYEKNPDLEIAYNPMDAPPQKNITSLLGASFRPLDLNVEGPLPLKKGDLILALTDGIDDLFSDLEMIGLLKRHQHAQALSQELVAAAREAGARKEITICHLKI